MSCSTKHFLFCSGPIEILGDTRNVEIVSNGLLSESQAVFCKPVFGKTFLLQKAILTDSFICKLNTFLDSKTRLQN